MSLSILLVEDEINLGSTLSEYLESLDNDVFWAQSVSQAQEIFDKENIQIVLMDIGLPDGSGLELAKKLRDSRKDFVLLFLSAMNDPITKLEGLELGADDYITKPFDLKELTLRLDRILSFNQSVEKLQDYIKIGDLKINFKSYELTNSSGTVTNLSQKECGILELLYRHKNEVVSRETIISDIWGENAFPTERTVDNYIVKLRKWTETDTTQTINITSVRGIGYKLEIKN